MKRVAIQGVPGANHEIAARAYFAGEEIEIVPCNTFKELFEKMQADKDLIGIVAIENTIAGSLLPNHGLLEDSGKVIVGEYKLRIKHNLVALKGQEITDITEVQSQPIALMQCEEFLDKHKYMRAIESEDTALSAKLISEKKLKHCAAICSSLAAEIYGLEILEEGIETNKRNFTRFLIICDPSRAEELSKGKTLNKSTLVFTLPHEEGSLAKILCILSFYHINLTKIQSLPIIGREWEYRFFINLTFDDLGRYRQSLNAIRPLIKDFKILGEYENFKPANE
ncbi:MAG: prephenate dehydratase [Paludibacteraceae bacterium]|nr:prephenate dehydratase [Paludibacteraceae bacterium]